MRTTSAKPQPPPKPCWRLAITWKDKNFSSPLYLHELSEGTLRFLWLVSLLHSPHLSTITMIDEPEVSLHPELLNILADLMREARKTHPTDYCHPCRPFYPFLATK